MIFGGHALFVWTFLFTFFFFFFGFAFWRVSFPFLFLLSSLFFFFCFPVAFFGRFLLFLEFGRLPQWVFGRTSGFRLF